MDITKEFENRDSFLHWFLICALSGIELTEEVKALPRDVTMEINGVEMNPLHAIKRLEEEFNRLVEDKAKELLMEKTTDIMEPFEDLVMNVTIGLRELVEGKIALPEDEYAKETKE